MKITCPSCGYHILDISSLSEDDVKNEQIDVDGIPMSRREIDQLTAPYMPPVKTTERSAAQGSGNDTLTTVDKVRIQELRNEGHSWARIRQMIGKNVTLYAIAMACKLDKKKQTR